MENNNNREECKIHLEKWQASGLSQAEYCRQNNLNPNTFQYWKGRFTGKPRSKPRPRFVELPVLSPKNSEHPIIELSFDKNFQVTVRLELDLAWLKR